MEKIWNKLKRKIRYGYLRVVRIKAPAESIALGLAAGAFTGAMTICTYFVTVRGVYAYHNRRAIRKLVRRHLVLRQEVSPEE